MSGYYAVHLTLIQYYMRGNISMKLEKVRIGSKAIQIFFLKSHLQRIFNRLIENYHLKTFKINPNRKIQSGSPFSYNKVPSLQTSSYIVSYLTCHYKRQPMPYK